MAKSPASSLSEHCKQLLANEQTLFKQDYLQHAIKGESKADFIGKPFLLYNDAHNKGILLIHGLMAAPYEVKQWANYLFDQGYNVYAPRLAGHGTSAVDLSTHKKEQWIASVDRGYDILSSCCDEIIIGGFSTGAALALNMAIKSPEKFSALISISAPLKIAKFSARFAGTVNNWNKLLNRLSIPLGKKEYVTNHADNPHINYLRCPVSSIVQIKSLMKNVRQGLDKLTMPALVMHATGDPKVDVQSSRDIFQQLGSSQKHYQEIDFHQHGIINGNIAQEVFSHSGYFLKKSA